MTPLHVAAKEGHVETVKSLVNTGVSVNIRGGDKGVSE